MKLTKKNREGKIIPQTYYSEDYKFEIEKGTTSWNVNERSEYLSRICCCDIYEYSFSCETLKEVKESI